MLNFFSSEPSHPLADAKELKRVLAELPTDNDLKAVDEVVGWLESLQHAEKFRADKLAEAVRLLDEAAQPRLRRLARAFLTAPRLTKIEERRFWTTCTEFCQRLASLYEAALAAAAGKDKAADGLKPFLPLITARLIAALGTDYKWTYFKYGPLPSDLWARLGAAYLAAEKGKFATKALQLYPGLPEATTPALEYLKTLVLGASSLDALLPLEMELGERLVTHFLPHFVLSASDRPDNLYWVDPAAGQPPMRLAKLPSPSPTIRFVAPGQAPAEVASLIRLVERGDVPPELALGGQYSARLVLHVLRHLAGYWAEKPPLRQYQRHAVKSRLFVLHGFDACAAVLGGSAAALGDSAESWIVDNVSLGGFGAVVAVQRDEWLRIGALLCVQPEGGDNWLLGVVRRYGKESDSQAGVGIQTIAKQARSVSVRPRTSLSYGAAAGILAIMSREEVDADAVRLVLPPNTFDLRESLEAQLDGRLVLLMPVESVEAGPDYEIARFRVRAGA